MQFVPNQKKMNLDAQYYLRQIEPQRLTEYSQRIQHLFTVINILKSKGRCLKFTARAFWSAGFTYRPHQLTSLVPKPDREV